MIAYKGFTADFTCRRFQFAVGETYTHCGPVRVCASGFHACPNPLDVLAYYPPATSRYAIVECDGRIDADGEGKIACDTITIVREITIAELVRASGVDAVIAGDYAQVVIADDYPPPLLPTATRTRLLSASMPARLLPAIARTPLPLAIPPTRLLPEVAPTQLLPGTTPTPLLLAITPTQLLREIARAPLPPECPQRP